MSNFSDQLDEIKTLLSSNIKTNKSFAYSTLLHLQEQSSNTQASIQTLAESSQSLIPPIVADVHDEEEEMCVKSSQVLFIIYLLYIRSILAFLYSCWKMKKEKNLIDSGFVSTVQLRRWNVWASWFIIRPLLPLLQVCGTTDKLLFLFSFSDIISIRKVCYGFCFFFSGGYIITLRIYDSQLMLYSWPCFCISCQSRGST